ncbi:thrombospondin type 3 repeat-containing protein [Hymenobacter sp. GOD-10R]|uniref:thrombospondin type 3 repeat-containing protein n=1 Tax=Hymenobacter sp. GOD-10R TaxID=3093922 RepID=UPI002D79754C|nr:thrombospondin type 3 repeat-containing protein [Hymenobacter sp. GOD-10R]WRQ31204.1 thrombospondin type 3 repeat-containing protein [Hymenobacter sp. GOD-10R]
MKLPFSRATVVIMGLGLGLTIASRSHAQTADKKTTISVYGSTLQYHGDLGSEWFTRNKIEYGGGLTFSRYLVKGVDLGLALSYGNLKFNADPPKNEQFYLEGQAVRGFAASVANVGVPIKLKLNNGTWALKEDAFFAPYLLVQPGAFLARTSRRFADELAPNSTADIYAFDVMAAAGIKLQFSPGFSVFVQTGQHYSLSDRIDGVALAGNYSDRYLQHTAGLSFGLGKVKDEDQDGVPDRKDKCASTPKGVAVDLNGCPLDGDGDGVPDAQDKCPTEKGLVSLQGCPDSDGDGITDREDTCPEIPGRVQLQGCPDSDGDGVIDPNDKCPRTPADTPVDASGCPLDRDGDGVPDRSDRCPDRPGSAANKGCPGVTPQPRLNPGPKRKLPLMPAKYGAAAKWRVPVAAGKKVPLRPLPARKVVPAQKWPASKWSKPAKVGPVKKLAPKKQ